MSRMNQVQGGASLNVCAERTDSASAAPSKYFRFNVTKCCIIDVSSRRPG
jgi:hypothetical protein